MPTNDLQESWKRTRRHLGTAFLLLPDEPVQNSNIGCETVGMYAEFLEHNELELAMEQLESLGEMNQMSSKFWRSMCSAAKEMNLTDRAERFHLKSTGQS